MTWPMWPPDQPHHIFFKRMNKSSGNNKNVLITLCLFCFVWLEFTFSFHVCHSWHRCNDLAEVALTLFPLSSFSFVKEIIFMSMHSHRKKKIIGKPWESLTRFKILLVQDKKMTSTAGPQPYGYNGYLKFTEYFYVSQPTLWDSYTKTFKVHI